jgi:hypothetical protein
MEIKMKIKYFTILTILLLASCSSSNIDKVKDGTMEFNETTTIGNVLDNYKICSNTEWSEFKTDIGEEVVSFICKQDIIRDAINNSNIKIKLTSVKETFQFVLNINDDNFYLDNVHKEFEWEDGKKAINSEDKMQRMKYAYDNKSPKEITKLLSGEFGRIVNSMMRKISNSN